MDAAPVDQISLEHAECKAHKETSIAFDPLSYFAPSLPTSKSRTTSVEKQTAASYFNTRISATNTSNGAAPIATGTTGM